MKSTLTLTESDVLALVKKHLIERGFNPEKVVAHVYRGYEDKFTSSNDYFTVEADIEVSL